MSSTPRLLIEAKPERGLPTPPLRLRRVHLHGVGPEGARFDPLDLDFTGGDSAASRVLLSLTNTGGKTTLITLVSSLVVPAARAQIADKAIGDYVLTGDTSHVICEWEDASTGTRTVTGAVMEWREGRRQPPIGQRSPTRLRRSWYLLRTSPDLPGIDDLPIIQEGRRVTAVAFLEALDELFAAHPAVQGVRVGKQVEWARVLDERTSIDPVLFSYQMRMNDSESGAEKLLTSFDSNDNVVRFFVGALNDERELTDLLSKLREYSEVASQRPELEERAAFGDVIQPCLQAVAVCATEAETAVSTLARAAQAAAELAGALRDRIRRDRESLQELNAEASTAEQRAEKLRRQSSRLGDIRMQLLLEEARATRDAADVTLDGSKADAEIAALEAMAWTAVQPVVRLDTARQERDLARAAYEAAERGLGPLRQSVEMAARVYAGRLEALIDEAGRKLADAEGRSRKAEAARKEADDRRIGAQRQIDSSERDLQELADEVRAAEAACRAAADAGWLHADEQPSAAVTRWAGALAAAQQGAATAKEDIDTAEDAYNAVVKEISALDTPLSDVRKVRDLAHDRLRRFCTDLSDLGSVDAFAQLVAGPPDDVDTVRRVIGLARTAAEGADARAASAEASAAAARHDIAFLDQHGVAPPGADTQSVVARLDQGNVGAVSGLAWIEANEPDLETRARRVADNPTLAGGVVVTDPARFGEALRALRIDPPRLRSPVTLVAITPDDQPLGAEQVGIAQAEVLTPDRATWDRAQAAQARQDLEDIAARHGQEGVEAREAARSYRRAMSASETFLGHWGEMSLTSLNEAAAAADEKVDELEERRGELQLTADDHRRAVRDAADRQAAAHKQVRTAERALDKAKALTEQLANVADSDHRQLNLTERRDRARGALEKAESDIEQAAEDMKAAVNDMAQARVDADTWRERRRDVPVEAGIDQGGHLETLRRAWQSARTELADAEQGMIEASMLERAERAVVDATLAVEAFDDPTRRRAYELAGTMEASSTAGIADACRQASERDARANRAYARAQERLEQAKKTVRDREPSSGEQRRNHIDLSNVPEWSPGDPTQIPRLVEQLDAHAAEIRERRDEAESAATDARDLVGHTEADIASFQDTIDIWSSEPAPPTTPFNGTRAAARDEMRRRIETHRVAEATERAADKALQESIAGTRNTANRSRWRQLATPLIERIRSLAETDLVTEAATLARRVAVDTKAAHDDLARLDLNRQILRDGLMATCREQRRLLREVSRASELPPGLGEISTHAAIKIRFDDAPDDVAAGRLDDRIESWAQELATNPKRASDSNVRTRWLADAVRDTVVDRTRAGAWSIEILKPRIDGRVAYCPPNRIKDEFSGGQVLTLAVLVYCALSRVRAAHRLGGARPPGLLLLDNPFGSASAEALIQMQHRLAAYSHIQLVCATALNDASIEAAFTGAGSVIVKLRNDGDLRRNLNYLRVRQRVVDGVDIHAALTRGRDAADPHNHVDAITYRIDTP